MVWELREEARSATRVAVGSCPRVAPTPERTAPVLTTNADRITLGVHDGDGAGLLAGPAGGGWVVAVGGGLLWGVPAGGRVDEDDVGWPPAVLPAVGTDHVELRKVVLGLASYVTCQGVKSCFCRSTTTPESDIPDDPVPAPWRA